MASFRTAILGAAALAVLGVYFFISLSWWCLLPWLVTLALWRQGKTSRGFFWLLKLIGFLTFCTCVRLSFVWRDVYEFPVSCDHQPLPTNQTGLKVYVGTLAKLGSRTMCHALHDLGFKVYHGEDFSHFVLWDFLMKEVAARADRGVVLDNLGWVAQIVREMDEDSHVRLAESMSRCQVTAVGLDGLELLTWPILSLSPDAKVVLTDWRTFKQWKESFEVFSRKLAVMYLLEIVAPSSLTTLPWGAGLRLIDPLLGSPIASTYRSGSPLMEEMGPMVYTC
eukprot:TRINITY_DN34480_c0_g1_i2.p1 TRINITY_DN34480_c0_g1~~TRINITY_DN34480_c0_g1_i2.p1  ORF type:complete len:280 (+),score=37.17 TRINITY_DN34480_c0_g1_i2:28-867(+)